MNFHYFIPQPLGAAAMVALEVEPAEFTNVYTGVRPNVKPFQPGPEFQTVGVAPCDVQFILHFWQRPWRFEMRLSNGTRIAKENTGSGTLSARIESFSPFIFKAISMKFNWLGRFILFGCLSVVTSGTLFSQEPADGTTGDAEEANTPRIDTPVVVSGVLLQGGSGNFDAPLTDHGFSLSMNGGVGLTAPKSVPGYDAFTIDSRLTLGSNKIGRHLAVTFGAANWFVPALSSVYTDTLLTADERSVAASTTGSVMAGFAIQLLSDRQITGAEFAPYLKDLRDLGAEFENADPNSFAQQRVEKKMKGVLWKAIRKASRKPSWTIGSAFRLVNVTSDQADIDTYDLYTTFAVGKGLCDFIFSTHYLKPLKQDLLLRDAVTFRTGLFIDLDDAPPVNTLGLTFGFGHYEFQEKQREIPMVGLLKEQPHAQRFDITVTFSNLFKTEDLFGTGLAVRYAWTTEKDHPTQRQFVLLVNTALFKEKKAK